MMPTPRSHRFRLILAGVDFSRESAHALRYAAATARICGGRVVALHAVDPVLSAAAARAYSDRTITADTTIELQKFVRKTLGPAVADRVDCAVVVGAARQALMAEARRRRPDVVVLGTNGRGGFSKMFFGSTTEALLRRYHGAVMVVPPHCADPGDRWPGGSIVAAVSDGAHHRAMMSAAAQAAQVFGAWLTTTSPASSATRSRWHPAPLILLPLPDAARLQTFKQGTEAYEFVRKSAVPVLVLRTGRRIGHPEIPHRAA